MDQNKLYGLLDWRRMEAIVYSEESYPQDLLGPHVTKDGVLIQAFIPTAVSIEVVLKGKKRSYPMIMEDDNGYFAVLVPGDKIPEYILKITFDDGTVLEYQDPYRYQNILPEEIERQFSQGICCDIYQYLGSHTFRIQKTDGIYFAVWAPEAMRVSLVGDFNLWDGRRLPMQRRKDTGIYELFVPGFDCDQIYKYEIKTKSGMTFLKSDPYAAMYEKIPGTASVIYDLSNYRWEDEGWMKERKDCIGKNRPMSVYHLHPGTWMSSGNNEPISYRELAKPLVTYLTETGYTHVELFPVMEYYEEESGGLKTTGYYAATSRYGTPKDLMYLIDQLHQSKIGVILDWIPAFFAKNDFSLCGFDGTCLYEHVDPRQGLNTRWDTCNFNYGRPQVRNFLIANALYWTEVFHADGICVMPLSAMLYLDYNKGHGQWVANVYGGKENLDAIDMIRSLNRIMKQKHPDVSMIAGDCGMWPDVTKDIQDDGLGFDFALNDAWTYGITEYMQLDPAFRSYHHSDLIQSMTGWNMESYLLSLDSAFSGDIMPSLSAMMPGKKDAKIANLKAAFGYLMTCPGKKQIFMGQDFGHTRNWNPHRVIRQEELDEELHMRLNDYVRDLLHLYKSSPALYQNDGQQDGFEWINDFSANENILVYMRKSPDEKDDLLIVCNFSPICYENHKIGVPYEGKYKEILNSDHTKYAGKGNINSRIKKSKHQECDERNNSITINVPPMGAAIFHCERV